MLGWVTQGHWRKETEKKQGGGRRAMPDTLAVLNTPAESLTRLFKHCSPRKCRVQVTRGHTEDSDKSFTDATQPQPQTLAIKVSSAS